MMKADDDLDAHQDSLMASRVIGSESGNVSNSDMGSGGRTVSTVASAAGMNTTFTLALTTAPLLRVSCKAWLTPWILFNTPLQACDG